MSKRLKTTSGMVVVFVGAVVLQGCAHRPEPLYYWGEFEAQQYGYLQGEIGAEDGIVTMEKVREEAVAEGKVLPPGFEAHLGMLYGLAGRTDQFEQHLEAERERFPESGAYVDFLFKRGSDSRKEARQ